MKITLIPNLTRKEAAGVTAGICKSLKALGADFCFTDEFKNEFELTGAGFLPEGEALDCCDAVIAVGGDGSIIHAAKLAAVRQKPILGINAGSTNTAGYYAASAVQEDGLQYLIVVLGGKSVEGKNAAYQLTSELATYALTQYGYTEVIKTSKIVCEVPVRLSTDADYVTLVPATALTLYLPAAIDPETDLVYSYRLEQESLDAPVTEGQVVGTYSVSQNGEVIGTVELVAKNSLARSEFLVVLDTIERFTKSTFFIVTVIAAVVLTVLYFVICAILRSTRRRGGHMHTRRIRRR